MTTREFGQIARAVCVTVAVAAAVAAARRAAAEQLLDEPIRPIPLHVALDADKVRLGDKLFHDPQLSSDGTVSCASCHDLKRGGTDNQARSLGVGGVAGEINAPTVFNSGFNFKQFWDGRAETLEAQIDGPLQHPKEMASSWPETLDKLAQAPAYAAAFQQLYPDGITALNVKDAIATYERSLYTPNAPFDRYLRGDAAALSDDQKEGYRLFKSRGCVSCHQGVGVGGNMFQVFGVMADYFAARGDIVPADLGRFNVTGDDNDRHVFKVPSLRNVALTAPYFHDGSAATLEEAVEVMGNYQLGRPLSAREITLITAFLRTLTGTPAGAPS
jgi:cytochrome c peroxidase